MFFVQVGQPLSLTPILTSKEATAKAAKTYALPNPFAASMHLATMAREDGEFGNELLRFIVCTTKSISRVTP
jgi:hypothetical protein